MVSKRAILITFPILLILGIYFLGPEPARPVWEKTLPVVPNDPVELEKYVAAREARHKLKPDNEARIVWADSTKGKTPYSVVYLHGFSASQEEGNPVHRDFAKEFGCNLYLARLSDHGVDTTEQLLNFTPDRFWETGKEALSIGKALGDKVILMSTSTGGTIALILAAEYPRDVEALINLSPNIAIANPLAFISNDPWGVQIARLVFHGKYDTRKAKPGRDMKLVNQYWNDRYRLEAVTQLEEMLEDKMNASTFLKIKQPSLSLYYYKNEAEQDSTVSVRAIIEMNQLLSTPDSLKAAIAIPGAGDHVIGSYITSKDIPAVEREVEKFAMEKLHLRRIN